MTEPSTALALQTASMGAMSVQMVDIGGDFLEVLHVYITPNAAAEYSAIECHVEPGPLGVITDMGMAAAGWKEE